MNRSITRLSRFCVIASLALLTLTACDLPSAAASTPPTPIPTASTAWLTYHGNGFSVSYPPTWTEDLESAGPGSQGVTLNDGQVTIFQITGYSATELQASCALENGESWATLAGLTVKYSNPEGVHRVWFFLNNANQGYEMDANDGFPTSTPQQVQQDNAVLATLKLDNATPGCPNWGQ